MRTVVRQLTTSWTVMPAGVAALLLVATGAGASESGPDQPLPLDLQLQSVVAAPLAADPAMLIAQVSDPAAEQRKQQESATSVGSKRSSRVGTWEMESIIVEGHRSDLLEEDRIGSYKQPRWTAHRRFPSTRIYVRPAGEIDLEQWYRVKVPREGDNEVISISELEMGLPYRLQLDLYLITRREGHGETFVDNGVELRYAFADWGYIWGNPTIYLEWVGQDSKADKMETKMLLGDELLPGWHWGSNLVWEQTTGDSRTTELEWTLALSHTLRDEKISVGFEGKFAWENEEGNRSDWAEDLRIGPSIQFRPLPQMHIDFAPLFGITGDSKRADVFVIAGWEL